MVNYMKLSKSLNNNFNSLEKMSGYSADLVKRTVNIQNNLLGYIFLESVSSDDKISSFLMGGISLSTKENFFDDLFNKVSSTILNSHIKVCDNFDTIYTFLASGFTILFIDGYDQAIAIETKLPLDRGITEATSEPIIHGPKDSFTENHPINIGLIRKRIKDKNLRCDEIKLGTRTKTKVATLYINDIVDKRKIKFLKKQLKQVNIDGILDSSYIRELIENKNSSIFPKIISTERPDFACNSLLNGKIVILVENSPYALIMPAVLTDFLHSNEDEYQKPISASFNRLLRIICLFITIAMPSIYIALMTFNQEIIPDHLLLSLASQRVGVPFPTALEVIIYVLAFEILREADLHSPNATGSAMSIVGALILGDSSVQAGLVSPIVIIIVAFTSISELVFYDIDMISAVREWRLFFMLPTIILGLVGFIVALIILITKLCSIECLETPYLTPISPLNLKNWLIDIFRISRKKETFRLNYLTENIVRGGDNNQKDSIGI